MIGPGAGAGTEKFPNANAGLRSPDSFKKVLRWNGLLIVLMVMGMNACVNISGLGHAFRISDSDHLCQQYRTDQGGRGR
jgi:hypothetical protein